MKFKNMPQDLEVVCVGTTQGHFAFDFSESVIAGANFAMQTTPLVFHKHLLGTYQKNIKKNAKILITLEYPVLTIDPSTYIAGMFAKQYAEVIPGKNPFLSMFRQIYYRVLPEWLDEQYLCMKGIAAEQKRNQYINHYKEWDCIRQSRQLIFEGWTQAIGVPDIFLMKSSCESKIVKAKHEYAIGQIKELIEYCRDRDWEPVLIGLPYSEILNQTVPDFFKEKCFYSNIKRIEKENQISFFDYSSDEKFSDINLYFNVWYLNARGRKLFTETVLADIF